MSELKRKQKIRIDETFSCNKETQFPKWIINAMQMHVLFCCDIICTKGKKKKNS